MIVPPIPVEPPITTPSVWWWCKFCRRNFSTCHLLSEHKLINHPELFEGGKNTVEDHQGHLEVQKKCDDDDDEVQIKRDFLNTPKIEPRTLIGSSEDSEDRRLQKMEQITNLFVTPSTNENEAVDISAKVEKLSNNKIVPKSQESIDFVKMSPPPCAIEEGTKFEPTKNWFCALRRRQPSTNFSAIYIKDTKRKCLQSRKREASVHGTSLKTQRRAKIVAASLIMQSMKKSLKTATTPTSHPKWTSDHIIFQTVGGKPVYTCLFCTKMFTKFRPALGHLGGCHFEKIKILKNTKSHKKRRAHRKNHVGHQKNVVTRHGHHDNKEGVGGVSKNSHDHMQGQNEVKIKTKNETKMIHCTVSLTKININLLKEQTHFKLKPDLTPAQSQSLKFSNNIMTDHHQGPDIVVDTVDNWTIDQKTAESILATCLFLTPPTTPPPSKLLSHHIKEEKTSIFAAIFDQFPTTPTTTTVTNGEENLSENLTTETEEGHVMRNYFVPEVPRYCLCNQLDYGRMVACDNKKCPMKWFHFSCVGLEEAPRGRWKCPNCLKKRAKIQSQNEALKIL